MNERFTDVGRGITLCWEEFGERGDTPMLLVMGLGTQMVGWHEDFCRDLADRGFHVIRFDNRDAGRSTHMSGPPPTLGQLFSRRYPGSQYRLSDMADDTAGLMGALEIAPAHVVGASMGGMIAQTLAAREPGLVRSLTSIMSNTGARLTGQPALGVYRHFLKRAPKDRAGMIEHAEALFSVIGTRGELADHDSIRQSAALHFERGTDPDATGRQLGAVGASGNRTAELRTITAPTLVMHGTKDRLVKPSGGRATAAAIPGARLVKLEGMGHDLPRALWPQILGEIEAHARAADEASARPEALAA